MPRSMRIPDDVWTAAVAKARAEGTTVTAIVTAALRKYVKRPLTPTPPQGGSRRRER